MISATSLLLAALPLASAHFQVTWPESRGFSEDTIVQYPCGGFNTVNSTRTPIPLTSEFPLQLNMEHTSVHGEVVLALSNEPTGDDFNIVLREPFSQIGPNSFCIGGLTIPSSLNITEGTNATIQVLTNGDPDGGLYQCIDVTFTNTALSTADYTSHCTNSSGVSASIVGGASPNVTGGDSTTPTGSAASGSAAATSAGATSASSAAWAPAQATAGSILLGVAGILGGLAVL